MTSATQRDGRGTYVRNVSLYLSSADETVHIRPIAGDDHDRLRESHDRLSPESRYRRFLAAKPHLTGADVRYLVEVDGRDHLALVATLPQVPGEPIVGVARCIRDPARRDLAEVAIVVGDDFQRRGLGAELVGRLAQAAVARGIRRFEATMLAENVGVQRLFEAIASGPVVRRRLGGLTEMEFGLPGADQIGADHGGPALAAA